MNKYSREEKCSFLDELFMKYEYYVPSTGTTEENILKVLIGTQGTTRLGAYPTEETVREITMRIKKKVLMNEPLEISSVWGPIKTVLTPERKIDLAEMLAIKQYQSMAERMKEVYEPGLVFNICLTDSHYEYIYGEESCLDDYCKGMETLAFNSDSIHVTRLSEKCKTIPDINQKCYVNYSYLREYWDDTNDLSVEEYTKVLSAKRLHDHGWVGDITPEMRTFYLKRMERLYPDQNYDYWVDKIIQCFAYELLISQYDLIGRKTATADSCLLRVPPSNFSRTLYSNRIRMRITPDKIIKNSAPPWTVVGAVSMSEKNRMHARILNACEYKQLPDDYEIVNYNGIDIFFYEEEV